ncbi:MAG: helix-turn-helix domain-containing protein [Candidatus Thiodiazotropha sp.]
MLLTKKQAAEQLAVSPRTVQRLIDSGKLAVVRITESTKGERIHPDDLQAFIQSKRKTLYGNTSRVQNQTLHTGNLRSQLEEFLRPNRKQSRVIESELDELLMTKRERERLARKNK